MPLGDRAVGVLAESTWQALKAAGEVRVTAAPVDAPVDTADLHAAYEAALDDPDPALFRDDEGVMAVLADSNVSTATYQWPYLAHVCMEPMNCTARFDADGQVLDVWVGTQALTVAEQVAARTSGLERSQIRVHRTLLGATGGSGGTGGVGGMAPDPGCQNGIVEDDEECDDGNDNPFDGCLPDCTTVDPVGPPAMDWTYYEVENTQCMNGEPAGFGINLNPDSPNVMIYLEGGGACFSDACDFTAFNIPFIPPSDGIFNRNNEDNPVHDWTMIYVPYCTGDIHAGDAEATLGGQMRQFRGYTNVTRYLERLVPSLPMAERVLLTGISAGGFGAGINASQVADAFGPEVETVVIDDSGPPLGNSVIPPCLQQIFRDTWGLDQTVLAACPGCDPNDFATDLFAHLATNYPAMKLGLYSNSADLVIRTFMGAGWGNGQHDNCDGLSVAVPAGVYADGLLDIRAAHPDRVSTFFVGQQQVLYNFGLNHTVLRAGYYLTTIDGTSVPEWVADVIDGDVTHVGP